MRYVRSMQCRQSCSWVFVLRILALDIGEKRVGIAISDASERIASPLCVLPLNEVVGNAQSFKRILHEWEPELMVCGLPYTLAGEEGSQAKRIKQAASKISASCGLPYVFTDERLSSAQAKRSLRESGHTERSMRGKIDMIAAGLFLQAWLDERAGATALDERAGAANKVLNSPENESARKQSGVKNGR